MSRSASCDSRQALMSFFTSGTKIAPGKIIMSRQMFCHHLHGGAMKSSRRIRVKTTLGELVSAIWEETEALFKSKKGERQLVVAYVLNDLLRRPDHRSQRIATKKR